MSFRNPLFFNGSRLTPIWKTSRKRDQYNLSLFKAELRGHQMESFGGDLTRNEEHAINQTMGITHLKTEV
jgi:hypothetical protein